MFTFLGYAVVVILLAAVLRGVVFAYQFTPEKLNELRLASVKSVSESNPDYEALRQSDFNTRVSQAKVIYTITTGVVALGLVLAWTFMFKVLIAALVIAAVFIVARTLSGYSQSFSTNFFSNLAKNVKKEE